MLIFTIKRIFCIVISLLNIWSMSGGSGSVHDFFRKQLNSFVESADVSVIVNPLKTYQTVNGFGTSAAWWAQVVGASENAEEVAKALYSDEGLALNIYRYNVGAGEADNQLHRRVWGNRSTESFYVYDSQTGEGYYDFTRDAAARNMLDLSMEYGNIDTVVLFANSPHYSMTITKSASGGDTENFSNLPPENYEAFADYMITIAEHFIAEGYPVKYISPINEPQWSWGGDWVGQEGCHYETDEIVALMKVFAQKIKASGLNVKLMGPESGEVSNVTLDWFELLASDPDIAEVLGSLAYHSYWSDGNAFNKSNFGKSLAKKNYPYTVDMTEWCELPLAHDISDFAGAMIMASVISQDLSLSNANSWTSWVAVNDYGLEEDGSKWSDGLFAMNGDASEVIKCERYYALAHFSKFIPAGSVRIATSTDVIDVDYQKGWDGEVYAAQLGFSTSAYKTPDGEIVVVIVNEGKGRTFTVNALSFDMQMEVYQSTANMKLENTYSGIVCPILSIPGSSITTIVLH